MRMIQQNRELIQFEIDHSSNKMTMIRYKCILIVISCVLMLVSSLSVSTFITNIIFQKPSFQSITESIKVHSHFIVDCIETDRHHK